MGIGVRRSEVEVEECKSPSRRKDCQVKGPRCEADTWGTPNPLCLLEGGETGAWV